MARATAAAKVPLITVAGGLGEGYNAVYDCGVDGIIVAVPGPVSLEEAMAGAFENIASAIDRALCLLRAGTHIDYRAFDQP